jgi:hypothetical protein
MPRVLDHARHGRIVYAFSRGHLGEAWLMIDPKIAHLLASHQCPCQDSPGKWMRTVLIRLIFYDIASLSSISGSLLFAGRKFHYIEMAKGCTCFIRERTDSVEVQLT